MACKKCGGVGHNSATCKKRGVIRVPAARKPRAPTRPKERPTTFHVRRQHHEHTPARQAILEALRAGPMTTAEIMRRGLNPRAANGLYQEGWLTIGPRGFEVARLCGCGCGGQPSEAHEDALMGAYYENPRLHLTPEQAAHVRAHTWFARWPLTIRGRDAGIAV